MNKNFIDLHDFEQIPNYMKNTLKKSWNPRTGDLFCTSKDDLYVVLSSTDKFILTSCGDNIRKDKGIPLLNETQLRRFIEEKFHVLIDITYNDNDTINELFEIEFELYEINSRDGNFGNLRKYSFKVKDLLDGYWELIQKVLEEEDRCQEE